MSLGNIIIQRFKGKIADIVVSATQTLLTKIFPLITTWLAGNFMISGNTEIITTTVDIDEEDLHIMTRNVFVLCFFSALLGATVFRVLSQTRRVAMPLTEAATLRRDFFWIGTIGYFLLLVITSSITAGTDFSLYAQLTRVNDPAPGETSTLFLLAFALTTCVIFVLTYSIFCYWLMPPALSVLSQPRWIRWLPRLLSRLEIKGKIGHA